MIKRSFDLPSKTIHGHKDGRGDVHLTEFFGAAEFGDKGRCFGITDIPPGASIGYHRHDGDQEAYYILSGEAVYHYDGQSTTLKPGDLALCETGHSHGIETSGAETLRYVTLILYT